MLLILTDVRDLPCKSIYRSSPGQEYLEQAIAERLEIRLKPELA